MPSLLAQIFAMGSWRNQHVNNHVKFAAYELHYNIQTRNFIIAIHAASEFCFSGQTSNVQHDNYKLRLKELAKPLIIELQQCNLVGNSHFQVSADLMYLHLLPDGLNQLISLNHISAELRSAINYLRVIDLLHTNQNNRGDRIISEIITDGGQLFNYVLDESNLFSLPHLFYIGDGEKEEGRERVIIFIGEQTANLMRDAFKYRINQIDPDAQMHNVKFCKEFGGPQHQVAFVLSKESFKRLITELHIPTNRINHHRIQIKNPDPAVYARADSMSHDAPNDLKSGQIFGEIKINVAGFTEAEIKELKTALKYLNDHIFNQYIEKEPPGNIPPYSEKEHLLHIAMEPFLHINSINVMEAVFKYINEPRYKAIINIHQNPNWDDKLYKHNTDKWVDFLGQVREHAFEKLLKKLGIYNQYVLIANNKEVTFVDPDGIIDALTPYLGKSLFQDHRSNKHLFNKWHNTNTVNKLQAIIAACIKQRQEKANEVAKKTSLSKSSPS